MMARCAGLLSLSAISVLLVTGCAAQAEPEPTTMPSTASATPTATPTPTAAAPTAEPAPTAAAPAPAPALNLDDPRSWIISFTAVGPLDLGVSLNDQIPSMTAFTANAQDACPWVMSFERPGTPSIWIPDYTDTGDIKQIVVQGWGSAANVAGTSPQTAGGIGIGATVDELRAAHPETAEVAGKYAPHYSLSDGAGHWTNFAADDAGLIDTIVVGNSQVMDSEYCG